MHQSSGLRTRIDGGYSLIEVMVTIAIMGTLLTIAVGGFRHWALARDHEGAATNLQTVLRQTQTRAITEGTSFCVTFDTAASTYTVWRYACGTPMVKVSGPFEMNDARVHLRNPEFLYPDGSIGSGLTFKPTGTATDGQVRVDRDGSAKAYVVDVEGFTGRVSII